MANGSCEHEEGFSIHGKCTSCGDQVHYSVTLNRRAYERRMAGGGAVKQARVEIIKPRGNGRSHLRKLAVEEGL